jgi:hypothetical protein
MFESRTKQLVEIITLGSLLQGLSMQKMLDEISSPDLQIHRNSIPFGKKYTCRDTSSRTTTPKTFKQLVKIVLWTVLSTRK